MDHKPKQALRFWPTLHPPILTRLPQPPTSSNSISYNSSEPSSIRHKSTQLTSLQDEIDKLEWEEDNWFQSLHETRSYGYSWLVPLGRQNTQEEDQESVFSASPRANSPPDSNDAPTNGGGTGGEGGGGTDTDEAEAELNAEPDLDAAIEDGDNSGSGSEQDEEEVEEEEGSIEEEDIEEGVNSDEIEVEEDEEEEEEDASEVGSVATSTSAASE